MASLAQVGGQGLFTKEIQRALLDEEVDLAVHSLKDLPTLAIPELTLAAVPQREPPRLLGQPRESKVSTVARGSTNRHW